MPTGQSGLARLSSTLSITDKLTKKRVHELYNKAFILLRDGRLKKTEDFLARRIEDQEYPEKLNERSRWYSSIDEVHQADEYLSELLLLQPRNKYAFSVEEISRIASALGVVVPIPTLF